MNLTVKDAARLLAVSEKTIYRWIRQGLMPGMRIGSSYRFNRAELLAWATSRRMGLSPSALTEPEPESMPLPTLADCLEAGGVFYRIGGRSRQEALADVVAHLRLPEELDRTTLQHALIARENLASTGIGDGIAVPHIHNPGLLTVTRPTVTLCFLENAVDFRAPDQVPVRVLFTLLSPTLRAQLHLQSQLMFALKQPAFRQAVFAEESRELIHAALRQPLESVGR